ncbi:NAD+ binding protein [Aureococcus anophagefferens]|nr:NAD+ binding protein [Aureococcus anophagefferens]
MRRRGLAIATCALARGASPAVRTASTAAPKLPSRDLQGVASMLREGAQCVVMLGAGASVAAGLPDFRTPGTGLYDSLEGYGLPYPEAVFELDFFKENPAPLLADRGQLIRCYTQNIDSLEREAGVPADRVVAAHGNFDTATCVDTGLEVDVSEFEAALFGDDMAAFNEKHGGLCKSDIVFFGEALPGRFFETLKPDFDAAELLLVVGTSLEVHPFASLVDLGAMPRALINREKVGEMLPSRLSRGGDYGFDFSENATVPRDVFLQGDADDTVAALMDAAGWEFPDK